jgi:hypothetical protein
MGLLALGRSINDETVGFWVTSVTCFRHCVMVGGSGVTSGCAVRGGTGPSENTRCLFSRRAPWHDVDPGSSVTDLRFFPHEVHSTSESWFKTILTTANGMTSSQANTHLGLALKNVNGYAERALLPGRRPASRRNRA